MGTYKRIVLATGSLTGLLVVAVLISPMVNINLPKTVTTFSALPSTDALKVRYVSQGCFHHITYDFVFQKGDVRMVEVFEVEKNWSGLLNRYVESAPTPMGKLALSDADIKGLDDLLKFYRSVNGSRGCTTTDYIDFVQARGSQNIAREEIVDGTCNREGKLTLSDVAWRLKNKN